MRDFRDSRAPRGRRFYAPRLVLRIRRRRAWPRDIYWWHSIDLGRGKVTSGTKTAELLEREAAALHLPDLAGKSVLDVGAWDGYYSFLAERAGARRVVALDYYTWSVHLPAFQAHVEDSRRRGEPFCAPHEQAALWDPEGLPGKRGFDLAHRSRNSRVEAIVADFTTVDLDALGTFDVVLFLGVIYHLENPLAAARRLREITRELAVVESEAVHVPGEEDRPMWTFQGVDHLGGGPGNWWVPNRVGLEHLLRAAGFAQVRTVEAVQFEPSPAGVTYYRTVAHAYPARVG